MSLVRKSLEIFTTNWLQYPLGLIANVIVIRSIGAEGKGVAVLLISTVTILSALGHLGAPAAAIYYLRKNIYTREKLISNFLVLVLGVCLLVTVIFLFFGRWYLQFFFQEIPVSPWLMWMSLTGVPIIMLFNFFNAILLGSGLSRLYIKFVLLKSFIHITIILLFVIAFPLGITGAVLATIVSLLVPMVLVFRRLVKESSGSFWQINSKCISDMINFGIRQHPSTIGAIFFNYGSNLLLSIFLDVKSVGYYSVASTAYNAVISIPRSINTLLLGETTSREPHQASALAAKATRNVAAAMAMVVITLSSVSPWLIPFMYGADFSLAVIPVILLLISAMLAGASSAIQTYFSSINRPGLSSFFNLTSVAVVLCFASFLIRIAGISGMGIAVLTGRFVGLTLGLIWFRRLTDINIASVILLNSKDITDWRSRIVGLRKAPSIST